MKTREHFEEAFRKVMIAIKDLMDDPDISDGAKKASALTISRTAIQLSCNDINLSQALALLDAAVADIKADT
jgi:hypothetical protein